MDWTAPSIFSLLWLTGAAVAPSDCAPGPSGRQTLPVPLDLTGRPSASAGLSGQTLPAAPASEGLASCQGVLPSVAQTPSTHSESGDVLHGLPAPDLARPIDEPKLAPQFQ